MAFTVAQPSVRGRAMAMNVARLLTQNPALVILLVTMRRRPGVSLVSPRLLAG